MGAAVTVRGMGGNGSTCIKGSVPWLQQNPIWMNCCVLCNVCRKALACPSQRKLGMSFIKRHKKTFGECSPRSRCQSELNNCPALTKRDTLPRLRCWSLLRRPGRLRRITTVVSSGSFIPPTGQSTVPQGPRHLLYFPLPDGLISLPACGIEDLWPPEEWKLTFMQACLVCVLGIHCERLVLHIPVSDLNHSIILPQHQAELRRRDMASLDLLSNVRIRVAEIGCFNISVSFKFYFHVGAKKWTCILSIPKGTNTLF